MIKTDHLTMHYGPVVALNDASFEVRKGEVVGLLVPNGAGKSTAMKILTTFLYPTSGTALVNNFDIRENPLEVRRAVGYLPEVLPLYMEMEVKDYLRFVGQARGLGREKLKERIEWVVEHCGLRSVYRLLINELSKGYKQRAALAQALLHDPEIIILDEPTSGLDPHQILEIRHLIRQLAAGKTIILSTHILQEAEAIADRIIIISRGRIIGDGTTEQLRRQAGANQRIHLTVKAPKDELLKLIEAQEGVISIDINNAHDDFLSLLIETGYQVDLLPVIGHTIWEKKWEIHEFKYHPFTLEETFLALTESEKGVA